MEEEELAVEVAVAMMLVVCARIDAMGGLELDASFDSTAVELVFSR